MSGAVTMTMPRLAGAVADAAARWSDADFPPRVRATARIIARTGYSEPMVDYALDALFGSITREGLCAVAEREIGGRLAQPAGRVCIISSRTTIGVAILPAIFAICAGCAVVVKDREDALAGAFFETLQTELRDSDPAPIAQMWDSQDVAAPRLDDFDVVVAYGRDETLEHIRAATRAGAHFLGYGSRASAGYVGRESLALGTPLNRIASGAARDLVLYESEGCLNLHVLFCERNGSMEPPAFARMLAHEIARANVEFPPGRRFEERRAAVAHFRDLASFRAAQDLGACWSDAQASYVVALQDARFAPPFLPRCLAVIPVDEPAQALAYLRERALPLEGLAISNERDDVMTMAGASGAARVCAFGELQLEPLDAPHGGYPRIAGFVR